MLICRLLFMITVFLGFVSSKNSIASEPPKDPILKIEIGTHTNRISGMATDSAGRYIVTVSRDKTLRVWNTSSGKLLSTLRPPIGEGSEGELQRVALSPDASIVAATGLTGFGFGNSGAIYLFNRSSGILFRSLEGLPVNVNCMEFSPDGRYLAAGMSNGGVRLYRTDNWALIGSDADAGNCYSVHFAHDNRLAVVGKDHVIRIYQATNRGINLIFHAKSPQGSSPNNARFSPDGTIIAVNHANKIFLLSSDTLDVKGSAAAPGGNIAFNKIAWSIDGRTLYAGGYAFKSVNGRLSTVIYSWDQSGKGKCREFSLIDNDNVVKDLITIANGGLVVNNDTLILLNADGAKAWQVLSQIVNFENKGAEFKTSFDGTIIGFSFAQEGNVQYRFNLRERTLSSDSREGRLSQPIQNAPGLEITDLKGTQKPKVNGKLIKLQEGEGASSFAIAPNGTGFALGTGWNLRFFSSSGESLWKRNAPGICNYVNISPDDRLVLAAFLDGTIRWFRVRDGQELLAFFPHPDRKRWVLWTPEGYYDASPGGEDLIGWHVNNGKNQAADFFPAAKFRAIFYRPDIIAKVLDTLDEGEALRLANAESNRKQTAATVATLLPPVVKILSPEYGTRVSSNSVSIRYSIRSPDDAPTTAIRILVDGRPLEQQRGVKLAAKDGAQITIVTIPERDCEVSIIAENRHSASEPATVQIVWGGKSQKQEEFIIQPKLYVLAVGVSAYKDKDLSLKYAAKDAMDFAAALNKQKGLLYREVTAKVLTDTHATKEDIMDGLEWLQREVTAKDVGVIFIAGHGVNDSSGNYYYLPQNADTEKLKRTGVTFNDIKSTVSSLAGKSVMFVDTCHSGNVMGSRRGLADINAVVNELSSAENGVVVFASSTGKQYSLEDDTWQNGAFTKALVEGFDGKADYSGKGKITINMLDLYLSERVKELTGGKQTPTTTKPQTIQDFPLAVKR